MTYPICIPLHHGGGKHGTDLELRFALRSLEAHFQDECEINIIGKHLPDWIQGVNLIESPKGLKSALVMAARHFEDGFFWYYDDNILLQDLTGEQMKRTPAVKRWQSPGTNWARMLDRVRERLVKEGHKAVDYSRPHGPYWFDKGMIQEAFEDWPGMKGKFPFESWILSKRKWPAVYKAVKQYYGPFASPPGAGARFMNFNDRGNTLELRNWLRDRFPAKSRWENDDEMSKKEKYRLQARHLHGVWEEMGRPELRTICECAVGPHALLAPFEGCAERALFVEPDPKMAAAARREYPWAEVLEVAVADSYGTANLRRLNGMSYVKGIAWAPAFDACPKRARAAGKVKVATVPFSSIDDGRIDLLNLDVEGSEWAVLRGMQSRPKLIQIELERRNAHYQEIRAWLGENGYSEVKTWGNANSIQVRS